MAAWQQYFKLQLMLSYAVDARRYTGDVDACRNAAMTRCQGDILVYHGKILSETCEYWVRELSALAKDVYASDNDSGDDIIIEHYIEQAEKVRMAALVEHIEFDDAELQLRSQELRQCYAALNHVTQTRYTEAYEDAVEALDTARLVTAHQLPESDFIKVISGKTRGLVPRDEPRHYAEAR